MSTHSGSFESIGVENAAFNLPLIISIESDPNIVSLPLLAKAIEHQPDASALNSQVESPNFK